MIFKYFKNATALNETCYTVKSKIIQLVVGVSNILTAIAVILYGCNFILHIEIVIFKNLITFLF